MLEFQEKRKLRRFLYSRITLAFLVVFIAFLLNSVWQVYQKQNTAKDNLDKTATSYESLRDREKVLLSEIERLKTLSGKEEEIREKYGLVKPGEEVIVFVDGDEVSKQAQASSNGSMWQKIKDWFK